MRLSPLAVTSPFALLAAVVLVLLACPAAAPAGESDDEPIPDDLPTTQPQPETSPAAASQRPAVPAIGLETGKPLAVEPWIIAVPDATGPAGLPSCKSALGQLPDKPTKPGGKTSTETYVPPVTDQMEAIVVDDQSFDPAALPGANPAYIPPRALEGSAETLGRIRDVLRRGDGGDRVRMSFYGASHTGGDWWTGQLRRLLQDRWGDLGHGFMLPAALYKGHRGNDINVCRTDGWLSDWAGKANAHKDGLLGFAGMSVSSSDPRDFGWVETTRSNKHGRKVQYFDVYTLGQPGGGTLILQVDGAEPNEISTNSGEPLLQRTRLLVSDGPHRLVLRPKGDGEVRIFGVSMERDGPGALIDTMGIRGRQAKTWLEWDETLLAQGLGALNPDLVVLAYGTNEADHQKYSMEAYRKDLTAVLQKLRRSLRDDVPCILAGPSDRGIDLKNGSYAIWDRTDDVAQVQRELAPKFGCAFWDWQQAQGGPGSMIAWKYTEPKLAAGDLLHHSRAGYEFIAERFLQALDALETDARLSRTP